MKRKRLISVLTSAIMVSAMCIPNAMAAQAPAYADIYANDKIIVQDACDSPSGNAAAGEGTSPDGTAYYTVTEGTYDFATIGGDSMEDLMWEADIRFDEEGGGFSPRNAGNKNYGTCIRRNNNRIAINTSGSSYTGYVDIDDTSCWYHIKLIGRYSSADANIDMLIYKYNGSTAEFIGEYKSVSLRNLYANAKNGADHIQIEKGTSVDNVKITRLGADKITIDATPQDNEMKAGTVKTFSYSATRQGYYISKPGIEWSVENADGGNVDSSIQITNDGILNADITAPSCNVIVKAKAIVNGNEVVEEYPVTINAVSTESEKFDQINIVSAQSEVDSGASITFETQTYKDGEPIEVEDGDIVWSVYGEDNLMPLGNTLITFDGSTMNIDEKVIAQTVTVRASTQSGNVFASKQIKINSGDAHLAEEDEAGDVFVVSDACEMAKDGAEVRRGSWDGSSYYYTSAGIDLCGWGSDVSDYRLIELDMKFGGNGSGFTPMRRDNGKLSTCVVYNNGNLAIQTRSSNYDMLTAIDSESWYHIELMVKPSSHSVLSLWKYNGTEREFIGTYDDLNRRNDPAIEHIKINANTEVDNVRVLLPNPDAISINSNGVTTLFGGQSATFTSSAMREGILMKGLSSSDLTWSVYDSENRYPYEGNDISINADGLVTVESYANDNIIYIRSTSADGQMYGSHQLQIRSSVIFEVVKIGLNEAGTDVVSVYLKKSLAYDDKLSLVIASYNEEGVLTGASVQNIYPDALVLGENKVPVSYKLPEGFNSETDDIKVFVWTSL